ncbi:hypothetical protein HDU92_006184 [Lobulomyces angularis]|nr:hypothetical protein HDU92_006184 [Lobulomyces angularis]
MGLISKLRYFISKPPKVLSVGHPILRIKSKDIPVSEVNSSKTKEVISQMKKVFQSPFAEIVGLSAPQIGHNLSIIAFQINSKAQEYVPTVGKKEVPLTFVINPKVTLLDDEKTFIPSYEACESIPQYNCVVSRSNNIRFEGFDVNGNKFEKHVSGYLARVIQHEFDHLQGILITDCMEKKSLRHNKYIDEYEMYISAGHKK